MLPVKLFGKGDTVLLLLHFFGSSHREWAQLIPLLEANHRCATADMPGFGEAVGILGFTVDDMVQHVRTLVENFATSPVVLVAHSFSGKVAMVLSADPPANLQQTILVAPSPLLPEPMTDKARAQMRERNKNRAGAEAFIQGSHHRTLDATVQEHAIEDVLRADEEAWLAWPGHGSLEDWSGRITALKVRTDLICGDKDKAIPLHFQKEHTLPLVERSGGGLHIIEDAAHMLPNEAPEELARLIHDAMRSL